MRDGRRKRTGIVAIDVFCLMVQFMASGEFSHEWY